MPMAFNWAVRSALTEECIPLAVHPLSIAAFARGRTSLIYYPDQSDTVMLRDMVTCDSFEAIRKLGLSPDE
jgi:hypothetical protein